LGSALDAGRDNGTYQPVNLDWICDIMDQAGKHRIDYASSARTWVFDPIDGTRTFVRGEMYAINIALLIGGKQAFSAVGCPRTSIHAKAPLHNSNVDALGHGCVVYAVRGHGAYVVQLKGDIIASVPTRLPNLKDDVTHTIRFVTKASLAPHGLLDAHELIASRLCASYPGCDLLPWTLRWAMLAMGLGNTTVWVYNRRERHAKIWDHAGAMLLFEETGGKITDVFGRDIDLTAGRTLSNNFGFVAAPKHSHARVLQVVHEVLTEGEYRWVLGDS
jgi:3'(2'), 5'-bisphosphate nucleotidase